MRTLLRVLATTAAAVLLFAAPGRAQVPATAVTDSGMLVVFDHDLPVAHEKFTWEWYGDSIIVTANAKRSLADAEGKRHEYEKTMLVVVDSRDFGLLRYQSDQRFQDKLASRGILPGDTVLTYYTEFDQSGNAVRLVQPPGRLFVVDTPMFSLFDVLVRSLAGKEFERRRVQLLVTSTDTLVMPLATITRGKLDTLQIGSRRIPAQQFRLEDPSVQFDLWADTKGRLLRMTHASSGMRVERAQPAAPAPRKPRARPAQRR
ncbi:MAG: hypothetical protein ABL977_11410 [Candidatus Eisenbacteria bacterium]